MQIESGSQITETKPTVNIGNLKGKAEGTSSAKSSEIKKFVTFAVGEEEYAVDIIQVREIQAWSEVTILPNQPDYMRGVLNLRGIIVPIFDLRCRFGQGSTEATRLHVVVIFAIKDRIVGVLVDRVSDILTVESEEIRPVPEMEAGPIANTFSGWSQRMNAWWLCSIPTICSVRKLSRVVSRQVNRIHRKRSTK